MTDPARLFHFTCIHGMGGIRRDGVVKPNLHPTLTIDPNLIVLGWFTDMPDLDCDALGLTSTTLRCDRMAYRFEVSADGPVWWPVWRRNYVRGSAAKGKALDAVRWLETADGAMPAHWWVSEVPVPLVRVDALSC